MRIANFPTLALFLGLLISGCNSGGGSDGPEIQDELVGKWSLDSTTIQGTYTTKTSAGADSVQEIDTVIAGSGYYVEFKSNRSYKADLPPYELYLFQILLSLGGGFGAGKPGAAAVLDNGTWSRAGDSVTAISESGDTLVLELAITDSVKVEFSRQVDQTGSGYQAVGEIRFSGKRL